MEQLRERIEPLRKLTPSPGEDFRIGCILLSQPFFLKEADWIPVPKDWSPNIVQGKHYDLAVEPGLTLYRQLQERLSLTAPVREEIATLEKPAEKYGTPIEVLPRLGQGIFRVVILDAYERRCAIAGEKVVPVLDAAHIKPYAQEGTHDPHNGILLRSDLHTLFDKGYVTVTPDYHFEVSKTIHEDFDNGQEYYALHGETIHVPARPDYQPSGENLSWHNEKVYRG